MKEKGGLCLISWNVSWQSKGTPHDRMASLVAHAPDVVALQEVRETNAYAPGLTSIALLHRCELHVEHGNITIPQRPIFIASLPAPIAPFACLTHHDSESGSLKP